MNIFGYLMLIVLALNAGFVIGAWWVSRPRPEDDDNCVEFTCASVQTADDIYAQIGTLSNSSSSDRLSSSFTYTASEPDAHRRI